MYKKNFDFKNYIYILTAALIPAIIFFSLLKFRIDAFAETTPITYKNEKDIIELKTYQITMEKDIGEIKTDVKAILRGMNK